MNAPECIDVFRFYRARVLAARTRDHDVVGAIAGKHSVDGEIIMPPTLYYSPGACSLTVHILLEEIGVPYERKLISLADGHQLTETFLGKNPKGRVPVLETAEGGILTELPAICAFLAAAHGSALVPPEPLPLGRYYEWFNWLSGTVHAVGFAGLWRPERFVDDERLFSGLKHRAERTIRDAYRTIESALAERKWAVEGYGYTVIDMFLAVLYRWGNRIGLAMREAYPGWTAHADRMLDRPAVRRALEIEGITLGDR